MVVEIQVFKKNSILFLNVRDTTATNKAGIYVTFKTN